DVWGRALFDEIHRCDFLPTVFKPWPAVTVLVSAIGRVEKDERVRHGTDTLIVGAGVQAGHQGRGRGEMTSGRTSAGRNSVGVDAMGRGGRANVADRAFRVLDAIERGSAVSAFCPVVGENDDHAAPGKILPLLLKLGQVSGSPAPAV